MDLLSYGQMQVKSFQEADQANLAVKLNQFFEEDTERKIEQIEVTAPYMALVFFRDNLVGKSPVPGSGEQGGPVSGGSGTRATGTVRL